jgi:hypothetical protein
MHAVAAVALLQWQDTKLHARVAALVSGYQTASLSKGRANLQQQQQQSKISILQVLICILSGNLPKLHACSLTCV